MARRVLLWDHDGVLVDTERWYFEATREALSALGIDLDVRTYLERMARGRSCWELAADAPAARIAEQRAVRNERYRDYLRTQPIEIDGVADVLRELEASYRMAVVTTARRVDFELIHAERDLVSGFEIVLTVEDYPRAKPDPAPYVAALDALGAQPAEALAIEDSARGLASARAAGIDCVIVASDFTATQDFRTATAVLGSIRELPAWLETNQSSVSSSSTR